MCKKMRLIRTGALLLGLTLLLVSLPVTVLGATDTVYTIATEEDLAEFAEKFMKKGAMFAVEGRLNVRSWEKDGERHWTTTVVVENCYFTGSKRDAENKPVAEQSRPATAPNKPAKQMGLAEQEGFYPIEETLEDDDLPF